LLEESYSAGLDLKRFAGDLLQYFRAIMICQNCSHPAGLLDVSDQELKELSELARNQSKETVYRYFQILMQGVEEMRYSSKPRLTMEMSFIKATQAGQVVPASILLSRLEALAQGGMAGIPEMNQPKTVIVEKPPAFVAPASAVVKEKPVNEVPVSQPKEGLITKRDEPPIIEPLEKPKQQQASPTRAEDDKVDDIAIATHAKDVRKNWNEFADYVKDRKQWMAQVLMLCENPREEEENLVIRFENPSDCLLLKKPDNLKDLIRYAQDFFQKELRVKISTRGGEEESSSGDDGASPREERRALANNPLVKMVTDVFDGKVSAIRTGPRFR
jgi:DNA polymerase-3 subunit gamma/tau